MSSTNSTIGSEPIPLFGFQERQPTSEEKALVDDVLNLYQLNPISAAYARYDEKATFHDPIGLAQGLNSIKAQFNAMPSIFSQSETKGLKFLENPEVKPPSVQVSLSQLYHFKTAGSKLVNSLVTFHVDPSSNLILKHDEEWDAKPNSTGDDGFFGKINELRKKFTASSVEATTDTTPKDQK
ncbi:uncharacterized protein IL334_003649 [Kwoniella shivajii]|uniref:SnoaL-like domain-containing protein n=1 Tax=Kwoniella shivajii TaxID=564305 RepID=A0ABZ1CZD7_9TREE|nr:hypothetical protein IL334_003649 [Kwoniella shivajii]